MSGRGTFSGTVFQATVGACTAGLLLTERPLSRLHSSLPGSPRQVLLETPTAVDDVHILTDIGAVFVQAKNSLTLSAKPGSEMASVADQFVRQYLEGAQENGGRRDLTIGRDRLALAVGDGAPTTVTNDLREALERNRTGSATNMPSALTHALQVLVKHLEAAWFAVTNNTITPTDQQALLALCCVLVIGDGQRQVVEESLSAVVASMGHEATLFDLLLTWANDAAQRGTGGDAAAIRRFLQGRVALAVPPSFQQDLERLRTYSAETLRQLERFTALPAPEGPVRIVRPVVARLTEAAHLGTLALTGEPGAGKSAVLVALANGLQPQHPVVCLTVETGATTLNLLRAEIGLRHPLVEVLRHLPRSSTAYLLLDALDASRGGTAEVTYRKLIEAVRALPGWHVVASVRSFDLRLGIEWQRLFRGVAPFAEYSDPSFPLVQHLHLGLISEAERADLARQSPSLDKALLAGGSRLETLAHNLFNLALLGELLVAGIPAQDLTAISTRGQLLARYWDQRVEAMGTPAAVALARLVEQMLQARALSIHRTRVEPATASSLDHLQQTGVLVTAASGQIGFRHHVLFDYAVATLLLAPTSAAMPVYLRREQAVGLLLAPALGYWVEELKRTREDFWVFVTELIADATLDPVVRVEVARLAVEAAQPGEELTELTTILNGRGELANRSFQQLAGALLTKTEGGQPVARDPWAHLLGHLVLVDSAQLGMLQSLLGALLTQPFEASSHKALGTAARALYARVAAEQRLTLWLAQAVIPHVVRTYSTDTVASRRLLRTIFSTRRFEDFGHLEVPVLAREVLILAASDVDFTAELFTRVFQGHNFSRNQMTPRIKGWIFAIESNAAQDFDLAQHHLAKAFPALLLQSPATAVRAFGAMLRGKWDTKNRQRQSTHPVELPVGDVLYGFEEDSSSVWAWELSQGRHTAFAKIHDAFMQWVGGVEDQQVLTALPGWLLHETLIALAWRVLFAAGALQGPTLGLLLWRAAAHQLALASPSTQQQASQLLAVIYPHLDPSLRAETEEQWLGWDFAASVDPNHQRSRTLVPLFAALGEALLATDEAREYLAAHHSGTPSRTDSSFLEQGSRTTRTFWSEIEADEEPDKSEQSLLRAVQATQAEAQTAPSPQSVAHLDAALQQLDQALSNFPVDGSRADQHVAILAEGLGALIHAAGETAIRTKALTRLLELTYYPAPVADTGTEAQFAAGGIQSYAQGRTEAAEALASLVTVPQLWSQIATRFESLMLHDTHPEVRWRMLTSLPALEAVDAHAFWELTEKFVELEQNPALCQRGLILLKRLVHVDPVRVEPFIITLTQKADSASSRSDMGAPLLVFLALNEALPASESLLHKWVAEYALREERLTSVLFAVQDRFTLGYGADSPVLDSVRSRAIEFALRLTAAVEPAIVSWTSVDREPTAEEVTAVKLLDEIAEQLYFALCADGFPIGLSELAAQRQFLRDYTPLICKLGALGTPKAIHHLLEILNQLVVASPAECFDLLSEAILRTTGVAKYEHEWLGVVRFVEFIGRYLADYRSVFSSATRQKRLVDCIAVFVEAGWSEARRLFHDLPGLLQ